MGPEFTPETLFLLKKRKKKKKKEKEKYQHNQTRKRKERKFFLASLNFEVWTERVKDSEFCQNKSACLEPRGKGYVIAWPMDGPCMIISKFAELYKSLLSRRTQIIYTRHVYIFFIHVGYYRKLLSPTRVNFFSLKFLTFACSPYVHVLIVFYSCVYLFK